MLIIGPVYNTKKYIQHEHKQFRHWKAACENEMFGVTNENFQIQILLGTNAEINH